MKDVSSNHCRGGQHCTSHMIIKRSTLFVYTSQWAVASPTKLIPTTWEGGEEIGYSHDMGTEKPIHFRFVAEIAVRRLNSRLSLIVRRFLCRWTQILGIVTTNTDFTQLEMTVRTICPLCKLDQGFWAALGFGCQLNTKSGSFLEYVG